MNYLNIFAPSLWFKAFFVLVGLRIAKYYWGHRRFFKLGNKLPGPKPLPFVGNSLKLVFIKKYRKGLLNFVNELTKNYKLARIWIGHYLQVFISSPEDAMIFYTSSKMLDRSNFFKVFEPIFGNSLLMKNGSEWKEYRHTLEPVYQRKFLTKTSSIFQQKTEILIHILEKETNVTFSINRLVGKCLADIACETFSGIQSDIQEQDISAYEEFEMILILGIKKTSVFWQNIDWIFKRTDAGKRYFQVIDRFNKTIQELIDIHKKSFLEEIENFNSYEIEQNPDIRLFFLRHHENKNDQDVRDYILSTVIPAIDTSNTSINMALMMLAIHQDVQEKLYEEISSVAEKNFDDKELRKLDYLNRVIQETLRLLPPIPVSSRKAGDDIWFGKHLVPKGASVFINIYAIHHDPNQYDNPEKFDPDHFLPEKVSKRHPYSYIPFGMGQRNCTGYNFAWTAMRIFLAKIVFNYKIECALKLEDVISRLRVYITLKMKDLHYPVRLIKR